MIKSFYEKLFTRRSLGEGGPTTPGVYIMKNKTGVIIYIGKAVNLRRRVESYFTRPHDSRIEALVNEISSIDYQQTDSALEALILESKLIKKYEPKYNIKDKDGKSFLYVQITREKFPKVLLVRGKELTKGVYFGPFVSASSIRAGLNIIRKIFPWADHGDIKLGKKPCFNYEIGLCPGTCIGVISKSEYSRNIKNLKLFLKGEKKKIIRILEKEMQLKSKNQNFEEAEKIKRQLFALQHIHDTAFAEKNEFILPGETKQHRIEGYDISNISGTSAVGAMVVFVGNKPAMDQYMLFKIKTIIGSNDTGMIYEVISRRFKNNWPLPNLILIDGGLGQVNSAKKAMIDSGFSIDVLGIAKGKTRKNNRFVGEIPSFTDKETLIKVRDEAHRFSLNYHIMTRKRNLWR